MYKLNCNWKTYVENYLEGYHIPVIHPLLNNQIDMNAYEVVNYPGFCSHIVPPSGIIFFDLYIYFIK